MVREVLLLGDARLLEPCRPVEREAPEDWEQIRCDLRDTLLEFRRMHGAGRGIAAPQIGVRLRVVYLEWPEPRLLINPELDRFSPETFELWDDCMCFPELLVRVQRHRSCRLRYQDLKGARHELWAEDSLSELLQHEVDHLDGVLAVARSIAPQAFALRRQLERTGELTFA